MADTSVTLQDESVILASTSSTNPPVLETIAQIADVDVSSLNNGSVLVYRLTTNMWTSTTTLDAQNMEGGEF